MKVRPLFEPRDLWVGVYLATAKKRVYVMVLPMLGFYIDWSSSNDGVR